MVGYGLAELPSAAEPPLGLTFSSRAPAVAAARFKNVARGAPIHRADLSNFLLPGNDRVFILAGSARQMPGCLRGPMNGPKGSGEETFPRARCSGHAQTCPNAGRGGLTARRQRASRFAIKSTQSLNAMTWLMQKLKGIAEETIDTTWNVRATGLLGSKGGGSARKSGPPTSGHRN